MKLTIIAIGSTGDVQPCIALGRALTNLGYSVRLVTLETFKDAVLAQGLEFLPVEGDAKVLTGELINEEMVTKGGNLLVMYQSMMKTFGAITESYEKAFSNPQFSDSDAILSQLPAGLYAYDLAESLDIPYFALSVIPQEVTGAWVLSVLPNRMSLGKWYNRLSYRVGQQLAWHPFRKSINRFRKHVGLSPTSFLWGNIRRMTKKRVPVIQGFSEHVIPHQPEWGDHVHTTGYWDLEEADWQAPERLLAFLSSGSTPIFIGFGSMPVPNPEETTQLIVDAIAQTGHRAILHTGWANLGQGDLPDNIYVLDYAPYHWLFPQMKAIIHHGGSGTTGLALRSGKPSMIVPFTADQPFWGERTHALGVGPKPIPFSQLTPSNLAEVIQHMTSDTGMQEEASTLGQAMANENGTQEAAEIIHRYLS